MNGVVITPPTVLATTFEKAATTSLSSASSEGTISSSPWMIPPRKLTSSTPTSRVTNTFHQRPLTSLKERRSAANGPTRSNSSTGTASDHAT